MVDVPHFVGHRVIPDYDSAARVTCWCEAEIVILPLSEIRAGRTTSCGDPACRPPLAARSTP